MNNIKLNAKLAKKKNYKLTKKILAGTLAVVSSFSLSGCGIGSNTEKEEYLGLDRIYLVEFNEDVYVLATKELDYEKFYQVTTYWNSHFGKYFELELNTENRKVDPVYWYTNEAISIPVCEEGLAVADEILTSAGQEPISPCFESVKTKIK